MVAAAMCVALRRSDRHPGGLGDLLERQTERILQHDDARLLRRDLREAAVQLAPQLRAVGLTRRIGVRGGAAILEQWFAGARSLPARHVAAGVDRQPVEPWRKLRLPAELLDLDATLYKCFLRSVLRIFGIAQQLAGQLFNAWGVPFAERRQGLRIAVFCSFDQDRIAQPRVDEGPFRTGGLLDWTAAAARQWHVCALVWEGARFARPGRSQAAPSWPFRQGLPLRRSRAVHPTDVGRGQRRGGGRSRRGADGRARPFGPALGSDTGLEHPRLHPASPSGRAAPSARAVTCRRGRRRPGDRRDHRARAGDQVSERPSDRHAQSGGDPGGVERRPGGARNRSQRQSDRAGASGRHPYPADVTARGAPRPGRPRTPARRDSVAPRARLRRLDYGNRSVRLRLPAASRATMRALRTRGPRKENTPARTVRVTSFPFTTSLMVAGSLTRKRSIPNESARNVGPTVSMRNNAVWATVPTSLVAGRMAGYLPSFRPDGLQATDSVPACRSAE